MGWNLDDSYFNIVLLLRELGHQMREDELKNEELQRQGYQLYQEYCQQGKQTKIENQVDLCNCFSVQIVLAFRMFCLSKFFIWIHHLRLFWKFQLSWMLSYDWMFAWVICLFINCWWFRCASLSWTRKVTTWISNDWNWNRSKKMPRRSRKKPRIDINRSGMVCCQHLDELWFFS